MDLIRLVNEGFQTVEAEASLKTQAASALGRWLTNPEFAVYQPQLRWLIEQQQWAGLLDRFYQLLPFGTGGRRGAVGIGPNRMNLWTLGASVQGHCDYLKERFPDGAPLHVVLAYDVRQFEDQRQQYNIALPNPLLHLSSRDLAHHAAGIYVANGIHATILPPDSKRFLATPELSFLIRHLRAHGGLNISASHNPPDDNGGKFYDERGGQPVPPEDQIMADLVEQVTQVRGLSWSEAVRTGRVHFLDDFAHRAYIDLCLKQSTTATGERRVGSVPSGEWRVPSKDKPSLATRHSPRATGDLATRYSPLGTGDLATGDLSIVFTPLHGVGAMTAMETLTAKGFRVLPVAEQMTPDGQFPNVTRTPNPEVPESMDRAAMLAAASGADLVLATDPDADRLGAMIPDRQGGWRPVTGNEIAALLTHFKLSKLAQQNRLPRSPIVITTEVTTRLVTRIARHFRAQVVNNLLVGFKYIADVLWQLEEHGQYEDVQGSPADFVIANEESHGILLDGADPRQGRGRRRPAAGRVGPGPKAQGTDGAGLPRTAGPRLWLFP